jgi:hypothetical protein
VPPHLYNETTIRKFQESIRELFLSKDTSLTRNYLRFLVQDITVRGPEITIRGRTDAAVALLASGADSTGPLNHPPPGSYIRSRLAPPARLERTTFGLGRQRVRRSKVARSAQNAANRAQLNDPPGGSISPDVLAPHQKIVPAPWCAPRKRGRTKGG